MEVPRHWRLQKQRYQLIGEECPHCKALIFPARDICLRCGGGTRKNNLKTRVEIWQPIPVNMPEQRVETRVGVGPT